MSMNRYISFLFMLIAVLSGIPQSSLDNEKAIKNQGIYNGIIKFRLELQQSKLSLKTFDNMLIGANGIHNYNRHDKLCIIMTDSFSINRILVEHYILELNNQTIIFSAKNDLWKHAVF